MYTVPLYEDLVAGVMKCVAVEIFLQTQRRLHPNLRRTLQQVLFQSGSAPANQNTVCTPPQQPTSTTAAASAPAGTPAAIALLDVNVSA